MIKVKVFRRKLDEDPNATPMVVEKDEMPIKSKIKSDQKKRKQKILKRKLEKLIETEVEVKTRPRTYTYFVTRKNGEGNEEFVSSSTEVRQFTYSVTVSKTLYKTDGPQQVMTSLVPNF